MLICKEDDDTIVVNIKCTVDSERKFGIPGEAKINCNGQIIIVAKLLHHDTKTFIVLSLKMYIHLS